MTPRLVVFDLDGTLVDSSGDLATALNRTLDVLSPGLPPLDLPTVRSFIGEGARVLVARSLAHTGLSHAPDEVLPIFLRQYEGCLLDTTRLYPGIGDLLRRLDGPLAVLTNKPGGFSRRILDGLGVGPAFFRTIGGGDLPSKKPDPAGLRALVAEAGAAPASTVMVGDSAIDVATGRAAGVRTIGVRYGFDAAGLQDARPDAAVDRPQEILAALGGLFAAKGGQESVLP